MATIKNSLLLDVDYYKNLSLDLEEKVLTLKNSYEILTNSYNDEVSALKLKNSDEISRLSCSINDLKRENSELYAIHSQNLSNLIGKIQFLESELSLLIKTSNNLVSRSVNQIYQSNSKLNDLFEKNQKIENDCCELKNSLDFYKQLSRDFELKMIENIKDNLVTKDHLVKFQDLCDSLETKLLGQSNSSTEEISQLKSQYFDLQSKMIEFEKFIINELVSCSNQHSIPTIPKEISITEAVKFLVENLISISQENVSLKKELEVNINTKSKEQKLLKKAKNQINCLSEQLLMVESENVTLRESYVLLSELSTRLPCTIAKFTDQIDQNLQSKFSQIFDQYNVLINENEKLNILNSNLEEKCSREQSTVDEILMEKIKIEKNRDLLRLNFTSLQKQLSKCILENSELRSKISTLSTEASHFSNLSLKFSELFSKSMMGVFDCDAGNLNFSNQNLNSNLVSSLENTIMSNFDSIHFILDSNPLKSQLILLEDVNLKFKRENTSLKNNLRLETEQKNSVLDTLKSIPFEKKSLENLEILNYQLNLATQELSTLKELNSIQNSHIQELESIKLTQDDVIARKDGQLKKTMAHNTRLQSNLESLITRCQSLSSDNATLTNKNDLFRYQINEFSAAQRVFSSALSELREKLTTLASRKGGKDRDDVSEVTSFTNNLTRLDSLITEYNSFVSEKHVYTREIDRLLERLSMTDYELCYYRDQCWVMEKSLEELLNGHSEACSELGSPHRTPSVPTGTPPSTLSKPLVSSPSEFDLFDDSLSCFMNQLSVINSNLLVADQFDFNNLFSAFGFDPVDEVTGRQFAKYFVYLLKFWSPDSIMRVREVCKCFLKMKMVLQSAYSLHRKFPQNISSKAVSAALFNSSFSRTILNILSNSEVSDFASVVSKQYFPS
ncbi:hypothetical protein RCL1_006208 [Eukaryota sp. TZLM3-RCL]